MKIKLYILTLFAIVSYQTNAQTTVNSSNVSCKWNKAGSPYMVKEDITMPIHQKWTITEGIKVGLKNIAQVKFLQDPSWNLKIMGDGDRGGHNVGLNYAIFSLKRGDKGYIRRKSLDNSVIPQGTEIELDKSKSANLWGW